MRRSKLRSISFGVLIAALCLVPARAQLPSGSHTLFFDDLTDRLVVTFDGVQIPATGNESFVITGPDVGFSFRDVDIYEPGSNALSDTIHLQHSNGLVTFAFNSDGSGINLTQSAESNRIILTETGGIQDAGNLTWSGGTVDVKFRSDVEAVPESAPWLALVGAGLMAMLGKRARGMAGV